MKGEREKEKDVAENGWWWDGITNSTDISVRKLRR